MPGWKETTVRPQLFSFRTVPRSTTTCRPSDDDAQYVSRGRVLQPTVACMERTKRPRHQLYVSQCPFVWSTVVLVDHTPRNGYRLNVTRSMCIVCWDRPTRCHPNGRHGASTVLADDSDARTYPYYPYPYIYRCHWDTLHQVYEHLVTEPPRLTNPWACGRSTP